VQDQEYFVKNSVKYQHLFILEFWNWEIGKSRSLRQNDPANNLAKNVKFPNFPIPNFPNAGATEGYSLPYN
jgi:hypothetical protein